MQTRLALKCGSACEDHPKDYWFTVDDTFESRPTLTLKLNELDVRYFTQNGVVSKFNIILLKQVSISQTPKLSVLKELLAENGTLIFYGWMPSWNELFKHELDIRHVFFFNNKTILFTGNASIQHVIEVINIQLKSCYMSPTALKELNYIHTAYERLRKTRPNFPTLLLCVLAHIEMYVELRKTRELIISSVNVSSIPGMSFFQGKWGWQDNSFDLLKSELEKCLERYFSGDDRLQQVLNTWNVKKQEFDTSMVKDEKKPYTSVINILERSRELIEYYDKVAQRNELNKLRKARP